MSIHRMELIARLEGLVYKHIYNNKNQIRYPITFDNGSQLKGRYILKVSDTNKDYFNSGHYKFGANRLYIYKAIEEILEYLQDEIGLDLPFTEDTFDDD